jgi:hypothetical protein
MKGKDKITSERPFLSRYVYSPSAPPVYRPYFGRNKPPQTFLSPRHRLPKSYQ